MSIFNVDLGQIVARAERRRLAIAHIQAQLRNLQDVADELGNNLEFLSELGRDAERLDVEGKDLLGTNTMSRLSQLGLHCEGFRRNVMDPTGHLAHVLAALKA